MSEFKLPALRYDWAALEHLRAELGEDYLTQFSTNDLTVLAVFVAAGSDLDAEHVYAESPPVEPTFQAVMSALTLAMHGPDGPQEGEKREGKLKRSHFKTMLQSLRSKRD